MNDITVESLADIQGWFDFADFYDEVADAMPIVSTVVELGPWLGKSTIYLAGALRKRGKVSAIHAVDTWVGSPGEDVFQFVIGGLPGGALEQFRKNIKRFGVDDMVIPLESDSVEAANYFDRDIDFVFFDTTHTEEHLKKEIDAWMPKVRTDHTALTIVGGHDIGIEGVRRAVESRFRRWTTNGPCWQAAVETWKQP